MLGFFLALAIIALVTVVPVMLAARFVGAQYTSFWSALMAVILTGIASAAVDYFFPGFHEGVRLAISTVIGALLFSGLLGTTVLRGFAISVIASILHYVIGFLAAGALIGLAPALA